MPQSYKELFAAARARAEALAEHLMTFLKERLAKQDEQAMGDAPKPSSDYHAVAMMGYAVIAFAFLGLGSWAAFASIDSAVIASGVISVESKRQMVQHLEGGIVDDINVAEGDRVKENDILFRLDRTSAQANYDAVRAQLDAALATEARLVAERDRTKEIEFPASLLARASHPHVKEVIADQSAQFRDRKAAMDGQEEILENRIGQLRTEIEGLAQEKKSAEQQLHFIDDELEGARTLEAKGLVTKARVSSLEREKARLFGIVGRNIADSAKSEGSIGEVQMQIQQLRQQRAEEVGQKLVEIRQRLSDLRERMNVASNTLERVDIRAPRAGTVQNINSRIYTIGAVVRPGDTMLEIVPDNEELVVDARVPVQDIDRLKNGEPVEVKFPNFHSRTTPLILGTLMSVSQDRLVDEATHEPYYLARVAIADIDIPADMKVALRPGMPAEIVFNTGERTVLNYLVRPLTDALGRSMRER
ncbi:HlyD family type I secretion periplasmic adaptor subunit [Xanthobacter sp. TB0139]|uniref:HlyD family type I secretion periplasmic adaptor subunit n=1 Tax=Xanthobacter sp. TB0139 TaxID=3459178 RepID=UPI004039B090